MNASPVTNVPLIRSSVLAACTLMAIGNAVQPATATATASQSVESSRSNYGTMAAATASSAIVSIAPPERLIAQQFSTQITDAQPVQSQTANYYQDYQSTAPAVTESSISPPPVAATAPAGNAPPTSINEPIWVVPGVAPSSAAADKVTVPDVRATPLSPTPAQPTPTQPTPTQPAAPATAGTPDLVVTATDIQIVGVDAELQQVVLNTIKTKLGGSTSQSQLKQDIADLLATGLFANASFSSRPNSTGLSVVYQIEPIVVRSLRLSNAQALTQAVANDLLKDQLGNTISPTKLNEGVRRINEWYAQNGYTLARVVTVDPTREGVVTIDVAEGVVRNIQIRFVNKEGKPVDEKGQPIRPRSQPDLVRRQIKLQPGQVFQEGAARQDLNRLAALGVFDIANVSFGGDARNVDVIYNLSERSSRGVNFGGGYNDILGLYGTISYQDTNFGGLAQRVATNVQIGLRDVQYDARFISPYRDSEPGTPGYGANVFRRQGESRVFDNHIRLPNQDRVRERRFGGGINLDRPLGPNWNGSLGLNYTQTSIRDRDGDVARVDERGNQLSFSGTGIDDLTTVSFAAVQDFRDNATNPSTGSVLTLSTEQSIPIGSGNILNNRLLANYAQYIPVDLIKSKNPEQPQVVAFNLQAGTVFGDLPPYNAFTLGGTNSVRGYGNQDVAVSRSYVLASAEYRFPIYRFIGGVAFADFGSGLGTQDDVPGEPGLDRGRPGIGFGAGLGLRVNSPIGIIRVDFGINNEGSNEFHFGFGQKF